MIQIYIYIFRYTYISFPSGCNGKESACKVRDPDSIPGLGRSPGEGHGNPRQYSCLEKSGGWRSLAGYSSWGSKESDTTERPTTPQQLYEMKKLLGSCKLVKGDKIECRER